MAEEYDPTVIFRSWTFGQESGPHHADAVCVHSYVLHGMIFFLSARCAIVSEPQQEAMSVHNIQKI